MSDLHGRLTWTTGDSGTCSEASLDPLRRSRQCSAPMEDWIGGRLAEAQAVTWKISIVRAIHGTHADAWSIDEMIGEYERMHRTILSVEHTDGRTETMTELRLRLEFEQVR